MSSPLYPTFKKRVADAIEQLNKHQVTPWAFMGGGRPLRIKKFDGSEIFYENIGFEGSPRDVFWSRYIEPFLEQLCISEIAAAVSMAKERGVDARLLLPELQGLFSAGFKKIYTHMADIDQRLRGRGYPEKVGRKSIDSPLKAMDEFLNESINAEISMWKPETNRIGQSMSNLPTLRVSREEAKEKITEQRRMGQQILLSLSGTGPVTAQRLLQIVDGAKRDLEKWAKYTIDLLEVLFEDMAVGRQFGNDWIHLSDGNRLREVIKWIEHRINRLDSILERIDLFPTGEEKGKAIKLSAPIKTFNRNIFIVHGHDNEAKLEVARFLEKLNCHPIILHEQADRGRTIIEKFEAHSDVSFAVVLLTPDDVGHPQNEPSQAKSRARQNVVLELGFFIGKLGRSNVCPLMKGEIEVPSDYHGVVYKRMDSSGAWQFDLAKELREAGIAVDMNKI